MKHNFLLLVLTGLLLLCGQMSIAATKNSTGSGNWTSASSWSPSGAPSAGDVITIQSGHTISVNSNVNLSSGSATTINVYGTLALVGNGSRLRLPSGSTITVHTGGSITGNGSNSQAINMGSTTVYSGTVTTVSGPQTVSEASPLPVEWLSLEAKRLSSTRIAVMWTTSSELNNAYFDMERTVDGVTFEQVARVAGNGTTHQISEYTWIDEQAPSSRNVYYRLKQVDFNGDFEYSNIMTVHALQAQAVSIVVTAFPNPVTDVLTVDLPVEQPAATDIIFVDLFGHEVKRIVIEQGKQTANLDVRGLKKGNYFLIVRSGEHQSSQRVLVH